ncbi:MAG: glycosyltransferase [Anaerolineaceae bacterium]|nr:glycosyltransferase [Anaerolineaceae bacterium]
MKKKVLIFVVSYNAEEFIQSVLKRIPENICQNEEFEIEILVIDDCSTDLTFYKAYDFACLNPSIKFTILQNPVNKGYGGNQKIGYYYAVQNHFDAVVLLHGDGQYPPEVLQNLIDPILNNEADVVLASRMIHPAEALKGKMPFYKWIGNRMLTFTQNMILGAHLSEFHTGYRSYRVASLQAVPFSKNSDYFDFDTDILIQMMDTRQRFKEIPIPTFYGTEISRVNGFRYAILILITSLASRIMRLGIFYDARFDYSKENEQYLSKIGFPSSQQYAIDQVKPHSTVLDLGCGPGFTAKALAEKQVRTVSLDQYITPLVRQYSYKTIEADLNNYDFSALPEKIDTVLALDVIEHLRSPETFLLKLREQFCRQGSTIILTTGNVAFLPVRLSLLMGLFNYSNRGILDQDHHRLFTFISFRRVLKSCGFIILSEKGIPAPFPLALGKNKASSLLLKINELLIHLYKSMFSFQMAFTVQPKPTLQSLLEDAVQTQAELLGKIKEN